MFCMFCMFFILLTYFMLLIFVVGLMNNGIFAGNLDFTALSKNYTLLKTTLCLSSICLNLISESWHDKPEFHLRSLFALWGKLIIISRKTPKTKIHSGKWIVFLLYGKYLTLIRIYSNSKIWRRNHKSYLRPCSTTWNRYRPNSTKNYC